MHLFGYLTIPTLDLVHLPEPLMVSVVVCHLAHLHEITATGEIQQAAVKRGYPLKLFAGMAPFGLHENSLRRLSYRLGELVESKSLKKRQQEQRVVRSTKVQRKRLRSEMIMLRIEGCECTSLDGAHELLAMLIREGPLFLSIVLAGRRLGGRTKSV